MSDDNDELSKRMMVVWMPLKLLPTTLYQLDKAFVMKL
jgi:hypothetical protein